jgi:hypothetical protein
LSGHHDCLVVGLSTTYASSAAFTTNVVS